MRLLYASVAILASRQANAVQIHRMCMSFDRAGHDVLLTGIGFPQWSIRHYRTFLLPWFHRSLQMHLMRLFVGSLLLLWRAELLFARTPLLAEAYMRAGCTAILELHSLPPVGSKTEGSLYRVMKVPALRRVVTISQALANDFVSRYGHPHSGCDVIVAHDGAEAGPTPRPPRDLLDRPRIGYFGHLYPGKGMEIIAELAPKAPEMDFDVYGGTQTDIAQWRTATEDTYNLRLHGHINHEKVRAKMEECDVLIAPYANRVSHVGGGDIARWMSPLKLFEYMAAGRPIVTSDLPVLREVVKDCETALLCPPGDCDAFVAALRRLARDAALRRQLGAAARRLLVAEYTWERRAERILDGVF